MRWRTESLVRAVAKWTVPTGFIGVPPPGPATPVIATARWAWECSSGPLGHHPHDRLGDRAQVGDQVAGDAQQLLLGAVGVGDEAALEHVRGARGWRRSPPPPARRCSSRR